MAKPKNVVKMWGGFVSGKLDTNLIDNGFGGYGSNRRYTAPAIFRTKSDAREQYEDVRPVEIMEAK